MSEIIKLGDTSIEMTRKSVKNVHLAVHPPIGHVTLVVPHQTPFDVARAYAISKLAWIREQQKKLNQQARETPRAFINRESHYLWGRRYLMVVEYQNTKPSVVLDHRQITLIVRPNSDAEKRAKIIHEWHKSLLHKTLPTLIKKWEQRLNVQVSGYFLQKMKTQWGSCNYADRNIRINTELVKKPKDLLEYVVVHELAHLIEPTHGPRFIALLDQHYPMWREARIQLNELPLSAIKG